MKISGKFISLLLVFCVIFSALCTSVQAENSKIVVDGKTFLYGKYFGTSDDDYLWIHKNKTFKLKSPYGVKKGTWHIESGQFGTYMYIQSKDNSYSCTVSFEEGSNKLSLVGIDTFTTSNIYYKAPSKISKLKLSKGKNYIKVSWNKINWNICQSSYIGYEIQYSTNKNFKSKKLVRVYSDSTTSKKIYDLKKNQKYYFKVRSFVINERVYCNATKDFSNGSVFSYNDFSKTKSITSPKKCKPLKTISKNKAKQKAFKVFKNKYGDYITKKKKYISKTTIYNKKYYIFMFEYYFLTQAGDYLMPNYRQPFYIVSLDGQEIKQVEVNLKKNYSLDEYFEMILLNAY